MEARQSIAASGSAARGHVGSGMSSATLGRKVNTMGLVAGARRNAPFIGVLVAIAIMGLALIVALVALLARM